MVPLPWHWGQIWLREKRPWLSWRLPVPPQRGQVTGWVPGRRPRAAAGVAAGVGGEVDRGGDPVDGVLEGEVELGLDVVAPLGAGAGHVAVAPVAPAEQAAEDVAEVADVLHPEAAAAGPAEAAGEPTGAGAGHRAHGPDLVVLLAGLGVVEDVVGGGDLLEGLLLAGVGVGVVLLGQLPIGAGDLLGRGRLRDPEDLVVVLLEPFALGGHWLSRTPSPWPDG